MKRDNILFVRIDTVENGIQVVQRVVVADHHENISRPDAQSLGREIITGFEIELIELRVFGRALARRPFGYGKDGEEDKRETDARDRRNLLGYKVDETQRDERQGDQPETERDLQVPNLEIERHTKLALA